MAPSDAPLTLTLTPNPNPNPNPNPDPNPDPNPNPNPNPSPNANQVPSDAPRSSASRKVSRAPVAVLGLALGLQPLTLP